MMCSVDVAPQQQHMIVHTRRRKPTAVRARSDEFNTTKNSIVPSIHESYPRCTPSGLIMMYERSMLIVGPDVATAVVAET